MQFSRQSICVFTATLILGVTANLLPTYYWQNFQSVRAQTEPLTSNSEADILLQKGVEQAERGELRDAVDTFQQAFVVSRYSRDRDRQEIALSNLAVVYSRLGQTARSIQFYQQAFGIFNNPEILIGMAKFQWRSNQREEALASYQKALIIYRQSGNTDRETETLLNIADIYLQLGRSTQTLQAYQEVLDIYKRKQNCQGEDETLDKMAQIYERMGQNNPARRLYRQLAWQQADRDRQCVRQLVPSSVIVNPNILRESENLNI